MQSRKFAIVVFTNDLLQSMDLFVVAAACKLLIPARLSVPRQPAWAKYKSRSQSVSQLVLSSAFTLCRIVNNTHGFSSCLLLHIPRCCGSIDERLVARFFLA